MAVARAELTPLELDFVVSMLDTASPAQKREFKRAIREVKRAQAQAWQSHENEMSHLEEMRSRLPTAPRKGTENE